MADDRIPAATTTPTDIAEGLPPAPHQHVQVQPEELDVRVNEPSAMQTFFAWEKLRILYNGILIAVFLVAMSGMKGGPWGVRELWWFLFFLLLINVSFCVGHIAEGYMCYFGIPRTAARWMSFLALTACSFGGFVMWR
jgi:hypothetical protein